MSKTSCNKREEEKKRVPLDTRWMQDEGALLDFRQNVASVVCVWDCRAVSCSTASLWSFFIFFFTRCGRWYVMRHPKLEATRLMSERKWSDGFRLLDFSIRLYIFLFHFYIGGRGVLMLNAMSPPGYRYYYHPMNFVVAFKYFRLMFLLLYWMMANYESAAPECDAWRRKVEWAWEL